MSKALCKLVKLSDVPILTESGSLPLQPDDVVNGYITLFPRDNIEVAKEIYFDGVAANIYWVNRAKLDAADYVIMETEEGSYMLIGPGDDPMRPIPVDCLSQKIVN